MANRIPPLQPGNARLYFYTSDLVGPTLPAPSPVPGNSGVYFQLSINGYIVGKITDRQVLYVDRPAGPNTITANSEGLWTPAEPKDMTLNLTAGETRYIRVAPDTNPHLELFKHRLHIRLLLMDSDQAVDDLMKRCSYVGPELPAIDSLVQSPNPPVQSPNPPVQSPNPPVQSPNPPVQSPNPPVQSPNPPVQSPNPPVQSSNPPVASRRGPVFSGPTYSSVQSKIPPIASGKARVFFYRIPQRGHIIPSIMLVGGPENLD